MASQNKNYMLNDNFPKQIRNATSTSDGLMSSEDKARIDGLFEFGLLAPATPTSDGIMTKEDKTKLDTIEEGANNYIHPIDENTRHVTDEQISFWNSGGLYTNSTPTTMTVGGIDKDSTFENVTYKEIFDKLLYPTKSNIYDGLDSESSELVLSAKQGKLLNAKINSHISNTSIHITEDERNTWNSKASNTVATQTTAGLMSAYDKKKLDNIGSGSSGDTGYIHPPTHPATMIDEDETHRFITDEQLALLSNLAERLTSVEAKIKTAVYLK